MTDRTRIRREAQNARDSRDELNAVLDAGFIAHIGIVEDGQPFVLPSAYARNGDVLLMHGSTGSRLFRALAAGAPTCATVTLLDGFVYARSAFHSSMNYRSAMIFGTAYRLSGEAETDALRVLTEHLLPGQWERARQPNPKERAATMTIALPIAEWSLKVRIGGPGDEPEDMVTPPWSELWAGHLPVLTSWGEPVADAQSEGAAPAHIAERPLP